MAPLPRDRVEPEPPFSRVGVDYTGELAIKATYKAKTPIPAYLVIFTCLVTRAVHIEIVLSNHTEEFLMAFKRMVNTRGMPCKVYSDNALTFKRAEKEILETVEANNLKIQEAAKKYHFEWHYSVEYHSAGSGVWERMVKSVKVPLRKVLGNAMLTYNELLTVVKEIEGQVNDRPLIGASEDTLEVLTPSMLCLGRKIRPWVDGFADTEYKQEPEIRDRWRYRGVLLENFWRAWIKQYTVQLQQRHRWHTKKPNLKVDDLVLLEKDLIKRHHWPVARIHDIVWGRDGLIRSVRISTGGDNMILTRSIHNIFPLETCRENDLDPFAHEQDEE